MNKVQNRVSIKSQVYQKLKIWDRKRAQILRNHKKASQQVFQAIQRKIEDSKDFLNSLETVIQQRVNQLKMYCSNSLLDSQFVLQKNKYESYNHHHDLLKQIYNMEANNTKRVYQKLEKMTQVLIQLKGAIQKNNQEEQQVQENKLDTSQLGIAKGDIRFLLECELPQVVENVIVMCQKVSKVYNQNLQKDLYFSIQQFVRSTYKQTNKHKQIGRALVSYCATSIKKQIATQNKIKVCLEKWSQIDGPIDDVFIEQLMKNDRDIKIKDFYNLQDLSDVGYEQDNLQQFFTNFKIEQFTQHLRLKLCDIEGLYNEKIETGIIVTTDCFLHLIRLNSFQPDFSIKLNSELLIKKIKQKTLQFIQYKKKFYFKKQRQFQFRIEFDSQNDLSLLRSIVEKNSQCKFQ